MAILNCIITHINKGRVISALKKNGQYRLFTNSINSVMNNQLRQGLERYGYFIESGTKNIAPSRVSDIIQKLEMCSDLTIKKQATDLISNASQKSNKILQEAINKAESLLDAVNNADRKYSPLFSKSSNNKLLSKRQLKEVKKLEAGFNACIKDCDTEHIMPIFEALAPAYSAPRADVLKMNVKDMIRDKQEWKKYIEKSKRGEISSVYGSPSDFEDYVNSTRFTALKEYIKNNINDKENIDYLWENIYLPKLKTQPMYGEIEQTSEIINLLKKIEKEYGTKTFIDEKATNETLADLKYVKDEFDIWRKAGKEKAKFPILLNITNFYHLFRGSIAGDCDKSTKTINIKQAIVTSKDKCLRHELAHLNIDTKHLPPKKVKKWMEEEYRNAEIDEDCIKYAKQANKNKNKSEEPFAVFAQGTMEKYNDKMFSAMCPPNCHHSFIKNLGEHNLYA